MNTRVATQAVEIPAKTGQPPQRIRYADDNAVEKAHRRAIKMFARMFRKLAE
jgi:hypothetical protein